MLLFLLLHKLKPVVITVIIIDKIFRRRYIMVKVQVPNLGQSGMDVKIEKWLVAEGGRVEKGAPLYELSNEKLTQEVESPAAGVLVKILTPEGETAPVGAVIAQIEE
jgi:pyruvate/2-oxoglutarate dehydrogenase complex dihydrolipoamide acyltransferase (E2) component